jgi:cyclopropane-fatty-acyl-phospholipid synthase
VNSFLIKGQVEHARLTPVRHQFRYPVALYCIDLDELPELDRRLPLFGYNRLRPLSIFDSRYLDRGKGSLREKLFRYLETQGCDAQVQRVMLITAPSYFNRVFNPVSFYYCLGAGDAPVCMVVEVNNTFGERHLYLLTNREDGRSGFPCVYTVPKAFHVSPFNDMEGTYRFSFSSLRGGVDIQLRLIREGETVLVVRLWGAGVPLTAKSQLLNLLKYPILRWKTIPRIHGQALRLFVNKGLPYVGKPTPNSPMTIRSKGPTFFERFCRKRVEGLLRGLRHGGLTVTFPDGAQRVYGKKTSPLQADLVIADARFFPRVILGSDIGLGESFMEGMWRSDHPTELIRILVRNMDMAMGSELPVARVVHALGHHLDRARQNTFAGSRRNIRRHYDLSNDFFALFLDDSMTYSGGIHESPGVSLEAAQRTKLRQLISKAGISADDHVLEIGCGWGAFAVEAVRCTGCRVTGITLSEAQYAHALDRVKQAGLEDRITLRLMDYRHMTGTFDKIVSIEMLEAVGHTYLKTFFRQCDRLLAPNGVMVLQVITVPDQQYNSYRTQEDWIQRHIFPGGHLPSLAVLCEMMTKHSDFIVEHLENIGPHYAHTLRLWRERFVANSDKLPALGFDDMFKRKWLFYLASCEAQFAERALSNLQLVLTRPKNQALVGNPHWGRAR